MSTYDSNIARRSDGLGSKETLPFQSIYNATSARSSIVIAPHTWDWHWYYVFYLLFAYQVVFILWRFWCKAPRNVAIAAYPTILGRWLTALHMIVDSETLLHNAYNSSNGKPFAMPMIDRWIIFITDRDELKRLETEPETLLSVEHALHELGSTTPILGHLAVVPGNKNRRSEAFRLMLGALKNKLRSNIPEMTNDLRERIKESISWEFENAAECPCDIVIMNHYRYRVFQRLTATLEMAFIQILVETIVQRTTVKVVGI